MYTWQRFFGSTVHCESRRQHAWLTMVLLRNLRESETAHDDMSRGQILKSRFTLRVVPIYISGFQYVGLLAYVAERCSRRYSTAGGFSCHSIHQMNGLFTPSAKIQDRQPTVLTFLHDAVRAVVGSAITPDEVDVGASLVVRMLRLRKREENMPCIVHLHVYAHSSRCTTVCESRYVSLFYSIARGCKMCWTCTFEGEEN